MRRIAGVVLAATIMTMLTGCSLQQIDQWKCDSLGWCVNGTVPSRCQWYPQPCCPCQTPGQGAVAPGAPLSPVPAPY